MSPARQVLELAGLSLLSVVIVALRDAAIEGRPEDLRVCFVTAILFVAVLALNVGLAFVRRPRA